MGPSVTRGNKSPGAVSERRKGDYERERDDEVGEHIARVVGERIHEVLGKRVGVPCKSDIRENEKPAAEVRGKAQEAAYHRAYDRAALYTAEKSGRADKRVCGEIIDKHGGQSVAEAAAHGTVYKPEDEPGGHAPERAAAQSKDYERDHRKRNGSALSPGGAEREQVEHRRKRHENRRLAKTYKPFT